MDNQERNTSIALEYVRGSTAAQICRQYKLSTATVRRILKEHKVLRKDSTADDDFSPEETQKTLGPDYIRLGQKLYNYRFKKNIKTTVTAELMGWTVRKLRNVEKGYSELTLTDLKEMANYMGVKTSELLRGLEQW